MPEESKEADPQADKEALEDVINDGTEAASDEDSDADPDLDQHLEPSNSEAIAAQAASKKRKSKRKKLKNALTGRKDGETGLSSEQLQQVLDVNPSLKAEVAEMDQSKMEDMLKKLNMSDLITGVATGKNRKDMANYKFWQTQPVPSFEEKPSMEEGPIKLIDPAHVPKEPSPLASKDYEWDTLDLTDERQLAEVYDLLSKHYVEDDEAMFRFNYSFSFLNWALKSPGWRKEWHIGVRARTDKRTLVAFISGIPVSLRIRSATVPCSEINFLCIHKKLRSKRLAPVLIQEITRRCYTAEIYQAIYTAGVVLPRPVASCRYFHRSLDWVKLWEVGFSGMPAGSTKERQLRKYKLPDHTATRGLREMKSKDVDSVLDLLKRYLKRTIMAQEFTREEVEHWLLHDEKICPERVIWSYVVEDPTTKKITDFFSFYCLESTVIGSKKHPTIRAAYLYYYATEAAFQGDGKDTKVLKERLNLLVTDALILAKKANFDVLNALTLLDNPLFLEQQKFGAGDGQLHYYLYNYRTAPIPGGVDQNNNVDERFMGGVGVVML